MMISACVGTAMVFGTMKRYESTCFAPAPLRIDQTFLLRKVSGLKLVKQNRRTWDELGEKVMQNFLRATGQSTATISEVSAWAIAKELVYEVLASRDPRFDSIRKRLGNLREPSTPRLLSTLGLWLAGVLGISVTATMPMVAVILYGLGDANGSWSELEARVGVERYLYDVSL
jgi:hypothetical protein